MAYVPKIFKDRAVEFPFRRLLTPVSGQANTVDVSRVPGTIFEVGDEPDAANLNAEFGKIKTETDAIITSLNEKTSCTITEHVIGTWLGKPLYSKTIDFGALPNATGKNVAHGIVNADKIIIDMSRSYVFSNLQFYGINHSTAWTTTATATNINIATTENRAAYTAIVTLNYTKTTD